MNRFVLLLPLLPLLSLLACDGEDDPADRVDSLIDRQVTEIEQQVEIVCDCWDDFGYESRTRCVDDAFDLGPSQVRCIKDAYAEDTSAAIDFLECVLPLEREYTACIDQRLECSDFTSNDPCGEDYSVGYDDCIGLPSTITRDLDACFE
ncbi:MAG: hypothetical protein AB1Z98_01365 [Nannocystaceae bacterium]